MGYSVVIESKWRTQFLDRFRGQSLRIDLQFAKLKDLYLLKHVGEEVY